MKYFQCSVCGYMIAVPQGTPKPNACPRCGAPSAMIHRVNKGPPGGRRGGGPPWRRSQP
ncbi:hypothetical protein J7L29_08330 [Candidatus Bathyarchaeota archaeon]|nr:hypothetical protein [Candidatus Bathyarchaeota archaeon]